jgi:DNA-binding transcriptional ArsR family regulator
MEKERIFYLTKEIYRLTLFFPKKEPLRYKIREIADEILAFFLSFRNPHSSKDILKILPKFDVLDGFLEISLAQNWVRAEDLISLKREYFSLRELLKKEIENSSLKERIITQQNNFEIKIPGANAKFRQGKILEFLKEKGTAQVWQIQQLFPQISKRTLRRDFESLVQKGLVERIGESNNTFYRLKNNG